MARRPHRRLRTVADLVAQTYPDVDDPVALIRAGDVLVAGRVATNPASLVREGVAVSRRSSDVLRGERKLEAALDRFAVPVAGRVALDVGAAAGGFTRVLLAQGASRVYAVDVGVGQLLGSLRQDPRVVNLERTNLAALSQSTVRDPIDVVTVDLSYVSLSVALPQLNARVRIADDADLIALVKPQFELGLAQSPTDARVLEEALRRGWAGVSRAGWRPEGSMPSPVRGARGSQEFFIHARRSGS